MHPHSAPASDPQLQIFSKSKKLKADECGKKQPPTLLWKDRGRRNQCDGVWTYFETFLGMMTGRDTEDRRALEAGSCPGSIPYLLCDLEPIAWPL